MATKSVMREASEIQLAIELIGLGARLQMLEAETGLSRERLVRLYKEIKGVSPPKGMLPFSVDWFMTWLPNIHASLFYNVYRFLNTQGEVRGVRALMGAYRVYLEHVEPGQEPLLSFTRAWILVRFFDGGMLQLSRCGRCGGHFVARAYEPDADFVCAICRPPPRACSERALQSFARQPRVRQPAAEVRHAH
ncbi:flagellar transcriptional regulator FlhC [Verticiella sediminum]|uniref:Flagellar transcriptional regulator FlhC n=1 Tax=Verticiella sediminum TaxID=1247510 RepID=A0A556ARZ6_9BURK|nr:flagellar transcriptional regulator FlhC [Verticiella sediminum]TSH95703.1 flagellar transcriptional regulator FlhC [Verticiella sediminum]